MLSLLLFFSISFLYRTLALVSSNDRDFHFKYSTDVLGISRQEIDHGNSPGGKYSFPREVLLLGLGAISQHPRNG